MDSWTAWFSAFSMWTKNTIAWIAAIGLFGVILILFGSPEAKPWALSFLALLCVMSLPQPFRYVMRENGLGRYPVFLEPLWALHSRMDAWVIRRLYADRVCGVTYIPWKSVMRIESSDLRMILTCRVLTVGAVPLDKVVLVPDKETLGRIEKKVKDSA